MVVVPPGAVGAGGRKLPSSSSFPAAPNGIAGSACCEFCFLRRRQKNSSAMAEKSVRIGTAIAATSALLPR